MGISGAKRALHLVRHLPQHGYLPLVLAGNPALEPADPDLAHAIPRDAVVQYNFSGIVRPALNRTQRSPGAVKTSTNPKSRLHFPPSWRYLTPFDRYLWDVPAAVRAGLSMIDRYGAKAIHVSADPWSGLVAGWYLHRRTGLPLVADLRDPWSMHQAKMALRPRGSQQLLRQVEETIFETASAVILNTQSCRDAYVNAFRGRIGADRFYAVHNAFDPSLFEPTPAQLADVFTVLYFGRFRQFVGPTSLLSGFAAFVQELKLTPNQARLRIVGESETNVAEAIVAAGLTAFADITPAVPFRQSLGVLQNAHVLTLVIEDECQLQIPGKLFDYLAAQRPILAISSNREANEILRHTSAGWSVSPHDPAAITRTLVRLYGDPRVRTHPYPLDHAVADQYSAHQQANKIATILNAVLNSPTARPKSRGLNL